ncbi:MAG: hypothetical protein ACOYON_03470 [Fimbriimonas sp.]
MKNLLVFAMIAVVAISSAQGGGRQGGQRGQFGRNNNSLTGLLSRPDVQAEIKLTDDQKTKLEAERQAGRGGAGGGGGRGVGGAGGGAGAGGQAPDPAEMAKMMAEREKATLAILTPEQAARLKELFIQRAGARAASRADIQAELGVTSEQKDKIIALQNKQREAMQSIREKMRNGEIERTQVAELNKKNEDILLAEMVKVLTPAQNDKLKAMGGKPFKFVEEESGN